MVWVQLVIVTQYLFHIISRNLKHSSVGSSKASNKRKQQTIGYQAPHWRKSSPTCIVQFYSTYTINLKPFYCNKAQIFLYRIECIENHSSFDKQCTCATRAGLSKELREKYWCVYLCVLPELIQVAIKLCIIEQQKRQVEKLLKVHKQTQLNMVLRISWR